MFAIAGGKGGCGKTTTTLGLARAVNGPAVAVDADYDLPNLHRLAGTPRNTLESSDETVYIDSADPYTRVLPAPLPDDHIMHLPARIQYLKTIVSTDLGPVFTDCPAGAGPDAVRPLRVADSVIVITTPAIASIRDAVKTAAMARALGTTVAGIIVTQADSPPRGLSEIFTAPILHSVPERIEPLRSSVVTQAHSAITEMLLANKK
jgi:septum site-determining protein MinD